MEIPQKVLNELVEMKIDMTNLAMNLDGQISGLADLNLRNIVSSLESLVVEIETHAQVTK